MGEVMQEKIEYTSKDGYRGVLYDWHDDSRCGENYQISVYNPQGREILHAYNAASRSLIELIEVVNMMRNDGI